MKKIKPSFYTLCIPVPETDDYLFYNTETGGLEQIDFSLGRIIEQLQQLGESKDLSSFDPQYTETIFQLLEKGYMVDHEADEKALFHSRYLSKREVLQTKDNSSIFITIGTTIICNMGCPYCFEFVKPPKSLKDDVTNRQIVAYIESMINKAPAKFSSLNITWYGGEPLVNKSAIEKLTPLFLDLTERYNLNYKADIITNGILLSPQVWDMLVQNKVFNVQVTIDGTQEIHDIQRPLKGKNEKNYHQILENLAQMPSEVGVNIRMNVDKKVAASFWPLLCDLKEYGIWPQKYKQVFFTPAWLRTYEEEAKDGIPDGRLSNEDFFDEVQSFRKMQLTLFNEYAEQQGLRKAKLKFELPKQQEECATWASPYGAVIDPEGNVHKCWETIHDDKQSLKHVSQGFNFEDFRKHIDYDRFEVAEECYNCKFLPVCDQLSCSHHAVNNGKPPCTFWKQKAEPIIKQQYLELHNNPDKITLPEMIDVVNTGHSNK